MERSRFSRIATFFKYTLSCFAVLLGVLVGILGVAMIAGTPVFSAYGPDWSRIAGLALLGFGALLSSVVALRSPGKAGLLLLVTAPMMGACLAWWQRLGRYGEGVSLTRLLAVFAGTSLLFVLPGVFWFVTSRAGWSPVIPIRLMPTRRILQVATSFLLFSMLAVVGVVASLFLDPVWESCYKRAPTVSVQRFPGQIALTGKIVMVGPVGSSQLASWSLIHVHRRFWGWPAWAPDFVILRDLFKKTEKGDEYFVDARRSSGLLTHFLPIIEIYPCCHTQSLDRATADIRALQDGPPKSGVRIIGRVYTDMYVTSEPARGVNVLIAGPGGRMSTTTDQEGVYDLSGLPAGHYSVWLESRSKFEDERHPLSKAEGDAKSGEVWGATLVACSAPGTCDENR